MKKPHKNIKTVAIIGLGSLGIMYAHHLSKYMPKEDLRIIADARRINKYMVDHIYCNGDLCDFNYLLPEESTPVDLLIFTVKFNELPSAIKVAKKQVGTNTIIMSLLNGIVSEEVIGKSFGMDNILYSVAQGMDPIKINNKLTYNNMGLICFGGHNPNIVDKKAEIVSHFFDQTNLPHEVVSDMRKKLWGKFMLNVGVNQAVAVFECDYGGVVKEGLARDTMISAMKEVIVLSEKENVNLNQTDLEYWLKVIEGISPSGKPSLRQDLEAKRRSEVELFAGTVLDLSKKHNIFSPTNQMLYDKIIAIESRF